jgi:hypothetical protein
MTSQTSSPMRDREIVDAFWNFLSWGEAPRAPRGTLPPSEARRSVPPAWWAYALGLTEWCPPKGEW